MPKEAAPDPKGASFVLFSGFSGYWATPPSFARSHLIGGGLQSTLFSGGGAEKCAVPEGANEQLPLPGSAKEERGLKSPMATSGETTALGELSQEATCLLCLDFFEQPMVLSCGHNLCRDCLAQLGPEASCPQCRAKVEPSSACPNRALANMVRLVKKLRLSEGAQEEGSGQRLCQEHGQPLQSFCSHEKSLLCPGCLEGHQGHLLLSLPEAAKGYKAMLDGLLEPLRKEKQKLLEQRRVEEQSRQECQELLAAEKQEVSLALESLQELLRERQPVWLGCLAEQEEKMEAEWVVALAKLSGEASRLQQLMAQTEGKCRQPDGKFLQDIQDTVDRCQSYVVGRVESISPRLQGRLRTLLENNAFVRQTVNNYKGKSHGGEGAYSFPGIEEPSGGLGVELGFVRSGVGALEKPLILTSIPSSPAPAAGKSRYPQVSVIPNDSTAHPWLLCQGFAVTWADRYQNYPDVPGMFSREFCVLGYQGFNKGWHWWEVSVKEAEDNALVRGAACWAVGVAKESVCRKGTFQLSPQEGIWAVGRSVKGEMVTFSKVQQKLQWSRQRLQVSLDYEAKKVEFLDVEMEASLYTFQTGPLQGETLRPFFYLGQEGVTLKCEEYPLLKRL
ncbi:zinc finger protein RFP-like [Pseudonaja textilis]|uniref:zinc finger protein RFP-like n=1 Tax=Pseudonaja textilis TaxID=8673 RepID=UPI000EAAC062|nr:zinc finger protein RFP-like [Pseudonaja textilis]